MSQHSSEQRSATCPRCGSTSVPILYGYPDEAAFRAADAGLVALGGCIIDDGVNRRCAQCHHEFHDPDISWEAVEATVNAGR